MVTTKAPTHVPGRQRFGGLLNGDYQTFLALFGFGALFTAFQNLPKLRHFLFGQSLVDFPAVFGLLIVLCAIFWRSLLRRGFVWAEPAALTWMDFAGVDRRRVVAKRMWTLWLGLVMVVGYTGALVTAIGGGSKDVWIAMSALTAAGAILAAITARRTAIRGETLAPVVLAVAGLAVAAAGLGPIAVEVLAGAMFVVAVAVAFGGEPVSGVGRQDLVDGWNARLLRAMAAVFMDPMLLIPESKPVPWLSLRRPTVLRLAWAGVLGRMRFAAASVAIACLVGAAQLAFPAVPAGPLFALGAYAALVPFVGGLGELWRNPGRRRWLGVSDWELRLVNGLVIALLGLGWGALLGLVTLTLGVTPAWPVWLAIPLAVVATLRTATRPPMNYDVSGGAAGLQALRGVDVLVVGSVLLSVIA
ncbi:DUF6297 family protein [Amycolatopsis sp. BJA-103]|uniref:DUF6297 family protein n=1 Tax=Amycolatopsis sp. BJA-103 TaxID=1911175 RepID=UPI000C773F59|nr:DUF6297 family protein [Amycolatopsis sp. BJA-103]AUI62566.1 hypothetical protein BKN51_33360 [Amycolatopsis sp. BJA-103]PNE18403.1 hypothetical protein B1H26_11045 [Amycolatopsis sp. BJA-103]